MSVDRVDPRVAVVTRRQAGNPVVFPPPAKLAGGALLGGAQWPALELVHATQDNHVPGHDGPRHCHRHAVYHLVVVTAGCGSFLVDDRRVVADAPRLFLMSPGQPHSFARRAEDDTVYSELTFQLAESEKAEALSWSGLLARLMGRPCRVPAVADITAVAAAEFRSLVGQIVEPTLNGHPLLGELLQGHLATALFATWRCLVADQALHPANDPVEAARRWLERNDDRAVTLDELAAAIDRSPKHLGRAFRQRYGEPPIRYHRAVCLDRAARLLRTTAHPIKRITALCGFADVAYFTRCFKGRFDVPPAAFRRRYLSDDPAR